MREFEHFILTRFNVRERPNDTALVTSPQWLNHRIILFEQFCFPSVKAQSCANFRWLVFFDDATPDEFKDRFLAYRRDFPNFEPLYITEHNPDTVAQAVRQRLAQDTNFVITTRLDNDDALCRDFIERVQAEFHHQHAEVINFPCGYIWFKGRLYLYRDSSNPFTSLIERAKPLRTIVARPHRKLHELAVIRQAGTTPAWLQVVHGSNNRNRLRGKRTCPTPDIECQFVVAQHTFSDTARRASFYLDRLFLDHLRNVREILIGAMKRLSLR